MRVVIAPDSFKGSLTAPEAARAMAAGVLAAFPHADVRQIPMADGGEGTAAILAAATGGCLVKQTVTGPLGEPVAAAMAVLGNGQTAVIEMAAASGLVLVPPPQRNPSLTTTYGTGELMRAALDLGCKELVVAIGGSATNDGGAGMAQALGARLLAADGTELPWGGAALAQLDRIDSNGLDARLAGVTVRVACDVDNPLCGPRGAAVVSGPQKGATPEMVPLLDAALGNLAAVVTRDLGCSVAAVPGAGAAGGLGAGLMAFLGGRLERGIELVLDVSGFDAQVADADLVLTGEGCTDGQTLAGKVPLGVARRAARHGVPVVVISGSIGDGAEALLNENVTALFSAAPGGMPVATAMARAAKLLTAATANVMRVLALGH